MRYNNVQKCIYYNRTNTCDRCGNKLIPGKVYRKRNKEGDWTGKWLCTSCQQKESADFRNNNLDPNSSHGKGYIFEQITCKARGIDNLNINDDNFNSIIDHSPDPEYGIIQSKGAIYNTSDRSWCIYVESEHEKEFDYIIVHCMDNYTKNVERVYIFPKKVVIKRSHIRIYKNPSRYTWYEKYRVDEKPYNDAFHNLDERDLSILRKNHEQNLDTRQNE